MTQEGNTAPPQWTILRLLEWTRGHFAAKGVADARLEAELLLSHALGIERIQLYVQHGRVVAEPQLSQFRDLVKRRAQHVPTQYLLGRAWFRNLTLKVTPAVLIPRPETELLVDEALAALGAKHPPAWQFEAGRFVDRRNTDGEQSVPPDSKPAAASARVLDLCTGSGCIAIAIASECLRCRVVATDLSAEALDVARENAATAGVAERVAFLRGDLFTALAPLPPGERLFQIITANPPYVAESAYGDLMPEVRDHEPRAALISGPTGLELVERILAEAPAHLVPDGRLLMEIGFDQAAAVRRLAEAAPGLELVAVGKDLGGHERVVHLRRKE